MARERRDAGGRDLLVLSASLLAVVLVGGCGGVGGPKPGAPPHHRERGFVNPNPNFARPGFWTVQKFRLTRLWRSLAARRPVPSFPLASNDGTALRTNRDGATVTWIGHATLLIQVDGVNVLTDPIWSERASPVSFAGPRRLNPPGLRFENLPPIHVVLISHDHYDSLDRATVRVAGRYPLAGLPRAVRLQAVVR